MQACKAGCIFRMLFGFLWPALFQGAHSWTGEAALVFYCWCSNVCVNTARQQQQVSLCVVWKCVVWGQLRQFSSASGCVVSPEHHLEGAGASKGGAAKPSQAKPTTLPRPTASCQDKSSAGA